eukprot:413465-Amorphochlora_amoeboformis.AAC.1
MGEGKGQPRFARPKRVCEYKIGRDEMRSKRLCQRDGREEKTVNSYVEFTARAATLATLYKRAKRDSPARNKRKPRPPRRHHFFEAPSQSWVIHKGQASRSIQPAGRMATTASSLATMGPRRDSCRQASKLASHAMKQRQ